MERIEKWQAGNGGRFTGKNDFTPSNRKVPPSICAMVHGRTAKMAKIFSFIGIDDRCGRLPMRNHAAAATKLCQKTEKPLRSLYNRIKVSKRDKSNKSLIADDLMLLSNGECEEDSMGSAGIFALGEFSLHEVRS